MVSGSPFDTVIPKKAFKPYLNDYLDKNKYLLIYLSG